jgi:hypothetical protein
VGAKFCELGDFLPIGGFFATTGIFPDLLDDLFAFCFLLGERIKGNIYD